MVEKTMPAIRLINKDLTLDDRTQQYIFKRIMKLERFCKNVMEYEVEACRDKKGKFCVDLMVKTPYNLYRAEEKTESVEGSIDLAVGNIKIQLVKDKEKLNELKKRGARSIKKMAVVDKKARFRK